MNTNANGGILGKLITIFLIGLVAIALLKLAIGAGGLLIGLTAALLVTVGPILLVGWLALKAVRHFTGEASDHL